MKSIEEKCISICKNTLCKLSAEFRFYEIAMRSLVHELLACIRFDMGEGYSSNSVRYTDFRPLIIRISQ
jgi:hypothetical protein